MKQWHALSGAAVLAELETDSSGLTPEEADRRLLEYGPNSLTRSDGDGPWRILWRQAVGPNDRPTQL